VLTSAYKRCFPDPLGCVRRCTISYHFPVETASGVSSLRMKRGTVVILSLFACFISVCFLLTTSLSTESIVLPIVINDQGFMITITYYYIQGPNTIILIGSVQSPQTLILRSLTALAFISGVTVGSGAVDEQYQQLTSGVAVPLSATITTHFNIYNALWFGEIAVDDGTTIPFHYDSTPITVVFSGQMCVASNAPYCVPWPTLNETSTLAQL